MGLAQMKPHFLNPSTTFNGNACFGHKKPNETGATMISRVYWRYIWSMIAAGIFSIFFFFALGTSLDWIQTGIYYQNQAFWELRFDRWGGIPFWFLGMLSIIAFHAFFLFRLAFLTASLELPWRGSWGGRTGAVRAYAPVHFLKILSMDIIYVVFLTLVYYFLASHPWYYSYPWSH